MKYKTQITSPRINWQDNKTPYSEQFKDVYFMPDKGLLEARHVFLDGNNLSERWNKLAPDEEFIIFECGFGSGLNCMATLHLWELLQPKGNLTYRAFEGFPLSGSDIERVVSNYREIESVASRFSSIYSELITSGNIQFSNNTAIELTLMNATAIVDSEITDKRYDAVFMDGFSPAKNPDMWSEELCYYLFQHSKDDATLATFSVAGFVKRNLKQAGFTIQKVPGFGNKREMLTAYKAAN